MAHRERRPSRRSISRSRPVVCSTAMATLLGAQHPTGPTNQRPRARAIIDEDGGGARTSNPCAGRIAPTPHVRFSRRPVLPFSLAPPTCYRPDKRELSTCYVPVIRLLSRKKLPVLRTGAAVFDRLRTPSAARRRRRRARMAPCLFSARRRRSGRASHRLGHSPSRDE